jgi:hypothetical protein
MPGRNERNGRKAWKEGMGGRENGRKERRKGGRKDYEGKEEQTHEEIDQGDER